jgi:hypothetical protein
MSYHREIHNVRTHIATLRLALLALTLLAVFMGWGWHNAPRVPHRAHPAGPACRLAATGARGAAGERVCVCLLHLAATEPLAGGRAAGLRPQRLSPVGVVTPAFRAQLTQDIEERGRRGELLGRVRMAREAPGAGFEPRRVEVVRDGDAWVVWLDLEITESVRGMNVKHTQVRYPLRVVRYDVDREKNPWGLALAGFASAPARIDPDRGRSAHERCSPLVTGAGRSSALLGVPLGADAIDEVPGSRGLGPYTRSGWCCRSARAPGALSCPRGAGRRAG